MSQFIKLTSTSGSPIVLNINEIKEVYVDTRRCARCSEDEYAQEIRDYYKKLEQHKQIMNAHNTGIITLKTLPEEPKEPADNVEYIPVNCVMVGYGKRKSTWYVQQTVEEIHDLLAAERKPYGSQN